MPLKGFFLKHVCPATTYNKRKCNIYLMVLTESAKFYKYCIFDHSNNSQLL